MARFLTAIALTLFACSGPRAPRASAFEPSTRHIDTRHTEEVAIPIRFFEIDLARAERVVFIIDRALGGELEIVKAELVASLASLPDGATAGVVFFGDGAISVEGPLRLDDATRRRIERRVRTIELAAASDSPAAAMKRAYAMDPRRVVLVAAGLDRIDGQTLLDEIRAGVRIDTVGVGGGGGRLAALAEASGGDAIER